MLKTIKGAFKSLALAGTIVYGAILAPELHNHYLRWEVGESVVQVLHPEKNGGGTGFAVKGDSGKEYIMTNRHVCEVAVNGFVRIKTVDRQFIRKVIYQDTVHDLCLIDGFKGLAPISLGSDQSKGEFHYVVGHPGLRQLTTSVGEYIGRDSVDLLFEVEKREQCPGKVVELPPLYQIFMGREFVCLRSYEALATSAVIYGGNSGSPVVNRWGNLIGVAFAGNPDQERDNYIVPLSYVKRLLKHF
jgi:S1-C subfamily serine protease